MESASQIKVLLQQLQRERDRANTAEQEIQRERQRVETAEHEIDRQRKRAETAENRTRLTTLPEFLDKCHISHHCNLTVQDASRSTKGDPANANDKLRPKHIKHWGDFAANQVEIWEALMGSALINERLFTSVYTLEEIGESLKTRHLGSELDLHHFLRSTVEQHVASIVAKLYKDRTLRRKFRLRGTVAFENHGNTLSPTSIEEEMQDLKLDRSRRRSPRLQTTVKASTSTSESLEAPKATTSVPQSSRPRADQICVYNKGNDVSHVAYVSELKPPHKLPIYLLYSGLGEIDLDDIVCIEENENLQRQHQRLVSAIITQAFSYMMLAGLEYGSVCTGEVTIFLRVREDDPETVYYYISVPKYDVGETTGWTAQLDVDNRLHLTAVGQTLAFTLRALQSTPRTQHWRNQAFERLNRWNVSYNDIFDKIPVPTQDASISEYWPTPNDNEYLRISPVRLRKRGPHSSLSGCTPQEEQVMASDEDQDRQGSDTPSRSNWQLSGRPIIARSIDGAKDSQQPQSHGQGHGQTRRYCTHQCLIGLRRGHRLDNSCPNAQLHGDGFHRIGKSTLCRLITQQLAKNLDWGFSPISRPGATGVAFRVTLLSHGYTLIAKGSPSWFASRLEHEATIYKRLRPIQGTHVPVHLGLVTLQTGYLFEGIAVLTHLMLLSFAGQPIHRITINNDIHTKLIQSVDAVHELGVQHRDRHSSNVVFDGLEGRVMIIDFDQAKIVEVRKILGDISNRKRKQESLHVKGHQRIQS